MDNPIRVLHILHAMNRGGAENALMNYYRNIERDKVQFDFLLTDPNKCLFEDEITSLGGKVYRVSRMTMRNPFSYLIGLDRFFGEHREFAVVHSHTSSKSVFPLWIAKKYGIKVRCSHSHNSMSEGGLRGLIRDCLMPFLKFVATDWLSCGNQAAAWLYGRKALDEGKVTVYKNVIETDKFRLNPFVRKKMREQYEITPDTILVGHTARFSEQKNHLFDIDILKILKKRGANVKLMLVGTGHLKDSIVDKARKEGVEDLLIFTGVVPNVYDYEQAFDVFILPSLYEGLPLSIIEAQVSGLPCITTEGTVSKECSVTDLVTYLPINGGADIWCDAILESSKKERRDRWQEVANAGYDARTSAKILQDFYIKRYNETK